MNFIRQIFIYFVLVALTINLSAYDIKNGRLPQEIIHSFKEGDARALTVFFNHHIELVVAGNSDVYSKFQSQIILKNFFRRNETENFSLLQTGIKGKVIYAVGRLYTKTSKFKVYILGKGVGQNYKIHQLRIEKDYE